MHNLDEAEPRYESIACFGGIYSNHLALKAAIKAARARNVDAIWALGDFGAFGPHPNRTCEILRSENIFAIQGNYEASLSSNAEDCHCGYTDPRDNHYAQISYDYTKKNTAQVHKDWMGTLPQTARIQLGAHRLLLCHGSPREVNEFLWRSMTPTPFIEKLLHDFQTDVIVCTHTGLHWSRLHAPARGLINVGALGRPANNGQPEVWFTVLKKAGKDIEVEFVPVPYDHHRLGEEMRSEGLPQEFIDTIETGWWTTCLEVLPAKERALGHF